MAPAAAPTATTATTATTVKDPTTRLAEIAEIAVLAAKSTILVPTETRSVSWVLCSPPCGTSVALAIRRGGGSELAAIAISKEELMRKLIATIAAALALAGVGLVTHTTTSDAGADAWFTHILPYVEQDNLYRVT
jgi:hypothetical protein